MSKYLSFDLETTGLKDTDYIIEFASIPVDVNTGEIRKDLSFHRYLKCPTFEELKPNLGKFVIENNESLIRKANKDGVSKEEFLTDFLEYLESSKMKEFFDNQLPTILGKSLSALDLPLLSRDFGRDSFLRKYFHHRVQDVSSTAKFCVDAGILPKGCESSHKLAQYFGLGEDVKHTALEDSIDVAQMYIKLVNNQKKIQEEYKKNKR
jgi:oligoribonuclease (3'-5' exoribonuclease)